MVRTITITFLAVMLFAGAILAQQYPAEQKPAVPKAPETQTPAGRSSEAAGKMTIVQGCLKSGPTAGTYLLTDVSDVPPASATPEQQRTPSTSTTPTAKKSYTLSKAPDDLSKHLNHKVEIHGTAMAAQAGTPSNAPPSSAASSGTPNPPSSAAGNPRGTSGKTTENSNESVTSSPSETLTVQSFKMISATCP